MTSFTKANIEKNCHRFNMLVVVGQQIWRIEYGQMHNTVLCPLTKL